ncbi:hypothetical protein MGYG_06157 [Nannizzia gypsea CBS 118893]|uniref:Uncharacterized protein n=1 Tax=Arthroderma gypseum (strain ATCC MYA-4604 / CBS 118893) TaxID=535722 RepID=E4V0M4_ARTGP|nr:hypothetical protein MGYG_06157 [Nannizzia gypsea CBS 118893]EFR03161.1 hypothetical protein MGYG_06157 [Nannizzia gypsea CBS 118893]
MGGEGGCGFPWAHPSPFFFWLLLSRPTPESSQRRFDSASSKTAKQCIRKLLSTPYISLSSAVGEREETRFPRSDRLSCSLPCTARCLGLKITPSP